MRFTMLLLPLVTGFQARTKVNHPRSLRSILAIICTVHMHACRAMAIGNHILLLAILTGTHFLLGKSGKCRLMSCQRTLVKWPGFEPRTLWSTVRDLSTRPQHLYLLLSIITRIMTLLNVLLHLTLYMAKYRINSTPFLKTLYIQ